MTFSPRKDRTGNGKGPSVAPVPAKDPVRAAEPEHLPPSEDMSEGSVFSSNGFGVADWLLEPLVEMAVQGLEFLGRAEVPPRLAPLVGSRPRRLGEAELQAIRQGLGRHRRFTEAVTEAFRLAHAPCIEPYEDRGASEILEDLKEGFDDPEHAVCVLLAHGRTEEARLVAAGVEDLEEPELALSELVEAIEEERSAALAELKRLEAELSRERRSRRALERRLETAQAAAKAARPEVARAKRASAEAERRAKAAEARADELALRVATLEEELDQGRRERRDLRAELADLEERYRRVRRELRTLRAHIPAEALPAPEVAPPEPPPSLTELAAREAAGGPAAVLEARHLFVLVDGWNVALGHASGPRLEDRRRCLEEALQRYQARVGNHVTIVYDGRKVSWFWVPKVDRHTVRRVFTPEGESADDYIVGELEVGVHGLTPVVVTSDRELAARCAARSAYVVSSGDLAASLRL